MGGGSFQLKAAYSSCISMNMRSYVVSCATDNIHMYLNAYNEVLLPFPYKCIYMDLFNKKKKPFLVSSHSMQ